MRTRADSLRADTLRADSVAKARADSLTRARLDSLRSDSLMREDMEIIRAQLRRADSIKTPTPSPEMPVLTEHPGVLQWNRDQLGSSGALTLGDLLESVPGLSVFRTGWIASPEQGAYLGDFSAIRIFQDGIELEVLDPRNGGIPDLSVIPIWQLEEVRIERGAFETRVHLRSWRVRSVTPATRVDIGNGDLQTNAYRGYFGRRFGGGQALQLGGSQFSTRDPRGIGDGDQLSLFGRVGWAKGRFGGDVSFLRTRRERTVQGRDADAAGADLAAIDLTNSDLLARVAYTDTLRKLWAQVAVGTQSHRQTDKLETSTVGGGTTGGSDSAYTADARQYVAALGWTPGRFNLSATVRVRERDSVRTTSPMVRGSLAWWEGRLVASGTAERRDDIGVKRLEASARLQPLSFLAISGAVGRSTFDDTTITGSPLAFRGEGALRVGRMWVGGGMLQRDPTRLPPPVLFDTSYKLVADPAASALFVTARGKFWKDVGLDLVGTRWGESRGFRPQYQSRAQLYVDTDWASRFPSGNLNIRFAVTHEYRSRVPFLLDKGAVASSTQYRLLGFQLEIRLLQATLNYQFRNFLNESYAQLPGFSNPRPVQFYGVRWHFFN